MISSTSSRSNWMTYTVQRVVMWYNVWWQRRRCAFWIWTPTQGAAATAIHVGCFVSCFLTMKPIRRSHVFKGVGSNTNHFFIANGGGWVWCFYEIVDRHDRQHPAESWDDIENRTALPSLGIALENRQLLPRKERINTPTTYIFGAFPVSFKEGIYQSFWIFCLNHLNFICFTSVSLCISCTVDGRNPANHLGCIKPWK